MGPKLIVAHMKIVLLHAKNALKIHNDTNWLTFNLRHNISSRERFSDSVSTDRARCTNIIQLVFFKVNKYFFYKVKL